MTKVLVNFIQDRSGSMASVWTETLSGFRAFVKDLKEKGVKDGVEYLFSLTTFDTLVETPLTGSAIDAVNEAELDKHGPRGSTALYDAVGRTIEATSKDNHGAEKIICVIVTDGQENSSREWSKDALNKAIAAKLDLGNWTFTYLGTQPETWDDANAIGIGVGATAGYVGQRAHATYAATSGAIHAMAASSDRQSKSLFTSRHANSDAMKDAGMTVKDDADKALTPPAPPEPPKRPTARWR